MNRFAVRYLLLIFSSLFAAHAWAQQPPVARVEQTGRKEVVPALGRRGPHRPDRPAPALRYLAYWHEIRRGLQAPGKAIDEYENALLDMSVSNAHQAATKDPHFALAYAVWSYAANRSQPNAEALKHAKALASKSTTDYKNY